MNARTASRGEQEQALAELLRVTTIAREAQAERRRLIVAAVRLGVSQSRVATVAGTTQPHVSRLVQSGGSGEARAIRTDAPVGGSGGGTL